MRRRRPRTAPPLHNHLDAGASPAYFLVPDLDASTPTPSPPPGASPPDLPHRTAAASPYLPRRTSPNSVEHTAPFPTPPCEPRPLLSPPRSLTAPSALQHAGASPAPARAHRAPRALCAEPPPPRPSHPRRARPPCCSPAARSCAPAHTGPCSPPLAHRPARAGLAHAGLATCQVRRPRPHAPGRAPERGAPVTRRPRPEWPLCH